VGGQPLGEVSNKRVFARRIRQNFQGLLLPVTRQHDRQTIDRNVNETADRRSEQESDHWRE
jgi:hypothetical protein